MCLSGVFVYLVQSSLQDLEGHSKGDGTAFTTVTETAEGGVADYRSQSRIIILTTTYRDKKHLSKEVHI